MHSRLLIVASVTRTPDEAPRLVQLGGIARQAVRSAVGSAVDPPTPIRIGWDDELDAVTVSTPLADAVVYDNGDSHVVRRVEGVDGFTTEQPEQRVCVTPAEYEALLRVLTCGARTT